MQADLGLDLWPGPGQRGSLHSVGPINFSVVKNRSCILCDGQIYTLDNRYGFNVENSFEWG